MGLGSIGKKLGPRGLCQCRIALQECGKACYDGAYMLTSWAPRQCRSVKLNGGIVKKVDKSCLRDAHTHSGLHILANFFCVGGRLVRLEEATQRLNVEAIYMLTLSTEVGTLWSLNGWLLNTMIKALVSALYLTETHWRSIEFFFLNSLFHPNTERVIYGCVVFWHYI